MVRTSTFRRTLAAMALRGLIPFDALALLFAGIVHLVGVYIPLGGVAFAEPRILPAGVVESLAGLIFLLATYAVYRRRTWAWPVTLGAHLFAIAGFVIGILSTRKGTTPFNHSYHVVMLGVFILGLALLLLPGTRSALDAGNGATSNG